METAVSEVRMALYRGDRPAADALVAGGAAVNVFDAAALGDVELLRDRLTDDPARCTSEPTDSPHCTSPRSSVVRT